MRLTAILISFLLLVPTTAAIASVGQTAPMGPVTLEEIQEGLPSDGSRWLTFGGDYANQRHSPLTEITPENVDSLVPQWTFQTNTLDDFETTTLVRDSTS